MSLYPAMHAIREAERASAEAPRAFDAHVLRALRGIVDHLRPEVPAKDADQHQRPVEAFVPTRAAVDPIADLFEALGVTVEHTATCPICGAVNRLRPEVVRAFARCGRCKTRLG